MYTTMANYRYVPTFSWNFTQTGPVSGTVTEALPHPPAWVQPNPADPYFKRVWAPAVRYLSGGYTMHFGASRPDGAFCIGTARASNAAGPFSPSNGRWCDPLGDPWAGQLDPYIYRDQDGTVWAYWSRQRSANGNSQIMVQQLTIDGMNRVGAPRVLVSFNDVAPYVPSGVGTRGYIENPAIVWDPHNGYNLLVSIGSYDQGNSYHTFELPCLARNDLCLPSYGGILPLAAAGSSNTGGASLLSDAGTDGNHLIYHANTPGYSGRISWRTSTFSFENNPQIRAAFEEDGLAADESKLPVPEEEIVFAEPPEPFPADAPRWDGRPERAAGTGGG